MKVLTLEAWSRLKLGIGPCEMRTGNWLHFSNIRATRNLFYEQFWWRGNILIRERLRKYASGAFRNKSETIWGRGWQLYCKERNKIKTAAEGDSGTESCVLFFNKMIGICEYFMFLITIIEQRGKCWWYNKKARTSGIISNCEDGVCCSSGVIALGLGHTLPTVTHFIWYRVTSAIEWINVLWDGTSLEFFSGYFSFPSKIGSKIISFIC